MLKSKKYRLKGVKNCPFLSHNGQLAHPLNPYAKAIREISGKRKKVDADHEEMAHLEFLGSLYLDEKQEPCIPDYVIRGMLLGKGGAARKQRLGKDAELGILITGNFPLEYEGPRNAEKLWKDGGFRFDSLERIQNSKVARTRPIFHQWSSTVEVQYNDDYINGDTVDLLMIKAGNECGIGDRHPTFGRFTVETM